MSNTLAQSVYRTLTLSSREVCPLFVPTGSNTSIWIPAAKLLETTTTIPPPTSTPIPVNLHSGLSTGSLLVILFITFSSIYFFGGVLALKLLRGAEGKEMIPNYDFWVDVPYLCRDGILFLVSGCNPAPAYERI
uniref:Cation-dependent mannose-6-phosphate receptor n=2 Tax=Timema TaxID=61471 RepID=A0A7R9DB29_TIMPO|nr:unnamed protein product [Timema douglasi]CAD7411333.1 unnamed protein product [Timema poppensis]